ncbi:hypothetical protein KY304_00015 [Candidatus Woesearchaeota archaeon]|nr:hypothetical protein [Candidatus Woesearchaeota archaeon]
MKEFISLFSREKMFDENDILQLRSDYYLVNSKLRKILKQTQHSASFIGIYLGKRKKSFVPSPYLLNKLKKSAKNKITVSDKGAWMFICRKHIYARSVVNFNQNQKFGDFVLVLNKNDECLGYGKVINKFSSKKVAVQNIFDIGDFVRRERRK